jgi:hypothetical protein
MFEPWFVELVSVLNNIVGALTGVALVILAIYGYTKWRTEMRGQAQFKLTSKMVRLASQLRDEFGNARFYITTENVGVMYPELDGDALSMRRTLDEREARLKRISKPSATLRKLEEAVWDADIILGEETGKLVEPLRRELNHLFNATYYYFEEELRNLREPNTRTPEIEARQKELWNLIYNYRFSEDEIAQRVENTVINLKDYLKKFLK